ncbi:MAG: ABC transporter permease [Ruminococcaceae bacterium]|nr:ABC transporter permease [Oscillospiraceae bacterium]
MKKISKYLIWYRMLTKRLLKKFSFVVILLIIPIIVLCTKNVLVGQESSIVKVALFKEDNSVISQRIIKSLTEKDSIIEFTEYDTRDEAENMLKNNSVDAVWVFNKDLDESVDKYSLRKITEPFIEVLQREENVTLQLSREMLYGELYSDLSYYVYKNYIKQNVAIDKDISDEVYRQYYNGNERNGDIVKIEYFNLDKPVNETNYLLAPIRGLLALIVVLCSLASVMYFLKDQQEGKFDYLSPKKRYIPAFAYTLSAATLSAFAVILAVFLSGVSTGVLNEIITMVLYILASTAFCLCFCMVFKSYGKLGATIPALIILMLVLSPVFFEINVLVPVKMLLPSYYYLNAIYNVEFIFFMMIYAIVMFAVSYLLNKFIKKEKNSLLN